MGATWLIGVVLCTISSFGTGLSKLTIRKSWLLERAITKQSSSCGNDDDYHDAGDEEEEVVTNADGTIQQSITKNNNLPTFWTPARMRYAALLFMSFFNPILDIGAFAFCSPSILAPFSGVSLAWVVLLSKRLVGEQPEPPRVVGAVLIMAGEVLIAVFGDHSAHNHNSAGVTVESIVRILLHTVYKERKKNEAASTFFMCASHSLPILLLFSENDCRKIPTWSHP